jgi:hypothetical protein
MLRVGFEPMVPVFERAKTVHALDRAATAIGDIRVRNDTFVGLGCTAPWRALEVGPFERVVRLLMTEVTSDQTLGNWYHFMKPIQRIRNLLTVK